MHPTRWLGPAWLLLLAAGLLGLWTSLHYAFDAWPVDSDIADTVMLWQGVGRHGLGFLASWVFAQDNWLLSLVPATSLLYWVFGPHPALVIGVGWGVFAACALLLGLLALRVSGRATCLVLAPLLLLANRAALGDVGYLAHPVTHTVTLLWGLLALLAAQAWLARGRAVWLAAALLALTIAAVSDPWADTALLLPIALACLLLLPLARLTKERLLALIAIALLAGVAAATRLFGLLAFLPATQFEPAGAAQFAQNLFLLRRTVALLFNILPGIPDPSAAWQAAICAVVALLLLDALQALARGFRAPLTLSQFIALVAALSLIATVLAFLGNGFMRGTGSGRFLLNLAFFVPLLIALCWQRMTRPGRVLAAAGAVLLMLAGPLSAPRAWLHRLVVVQDNGARALADFLQAHGLTYGYGTYFGAEANAVTWLSDGAVTMRPVSFDYLNGHLLYPLVETSELWYAPGDAPPGQDRIFVIVDTQNCSSMDVCLSGLQQQFGPADEVLPYRDMHVLVWHHKLIR